LRIIHLLAPAPFGGLERVVEMLAVAQRAAGHEVHVVVSIAPDPTDHPFVTTLRQREVPVIEIRGSARAYRHEYRQLKQVFARLQPDVVHTHGYRSDVLGWLGARGRPIALTSTAHGFTGGGGLKGRVYEWIQLSAWRAHQAVIAVSRPLVLKLTAAGIQADRVHLLPNGWGRGAELLSRQEARQALGLPVEATLVAWVGRLSREKGADVMIDAVPFLPAGVTLVMVGDGPERALLEPRTAQPGMAGRVIWQGMVPGSARYLAAFDAFALSSRTEGTPIALFEAMAARLPIVATAVGGVPDVVTAREAVLVPSEDPAALGAAITRIFEESATATRVDAAAARLEEEYGVEQWVRRHDEIYRTAIAAR
jgi:glycosyltransferase involved in cell wall biosynthesis